MIYLLSDIHAGETSAIDGLRRYFEIAGNDDILIILGDVGVGFEDTEQNREFDELFLSSTKKIAFLDGNHENFAYINSFPEEDWSGGRVHRLTDNIVHLERGYVYEIEGKRFFTFGGWASIYASYISGRRSFVKANDSSSRHASIFAWCPDKSTSGTRMP